MKKSASTKTTEIPPIFKELAAELKGKPVTATVQRKVPKQMEEEIQKVICDERVATETDGTCFRIVGCILTAAFIRQAIRN